MKPTIEQWQQYQTAFDYFNERLFDGQLPNCILNFSRQNQNRTRGYFSPERWRKDGEVTHEINLSPRILTTDEPIRSLSTLVHEMVHLWQHAYGRSPKNGYHNKEWAEKMGSVGLIPSHTGEPGGRRTGMRCSHYVQENGLYLRAFQEASPEILLPWQPTHEAAHPKSRRLPRCAPWCRASCIDEPGRTRSWGQSAPR